MSMRQTNILQRLADGDTMTQVAKDLGVKRWTIEWHVKLCREFLGADTTVQAIAMSLRRGYIS